MFGSLGLQNSVFGGGKRKRAVPEITKEFLDFLAQDNNPTDRIGQEFSYIAMITGDTGSGKSTLLDILLDLHLKFNPRRWIAFYRANDQFIRELNARVPKHMKDRIVGIDNILGLERQSFPPSEFIFVADEGGLDLSAKESLRLEMRPIVKLAKKSRHYKGIFYMLDQTKSVLKDLRSMCHFRFYKSINEDYIHEQDDWFAQMYERKLVSLTEIETVFRSNYKYFLKPTGKKYLRGKIVLDAATYAPWALQEELSQNLKNESVDHDFAQYNKLKPKLDEFADIIYKEFGDRLMKAHTFAVVEAFLEEEYPMEYYELQKYTRKIFNKALLLADREDQKKANTPSPVIPMPTPLIASGITFAEYCRDRVRQVASGNAGDIVYLWAKGASQRDISESLKISRNTVMPLLQKFRVEGIDTHGQVRSGYLFQDWIAENRGGDIRGKMPYEGNEADFIDKTNRIFSCKCQECTEKSIRFAVPDDVGPEYRLAVARGTTFFVLYYNPKWGEYVLEKEVNPKAMEPAIVFYKPKREIPSTNPPISVTN